MRPIVSRAPDQSTLRGRPCVRGPGGIWFYHLMTFDAERFRRLLRAILVGSLTGVVLLLGIAVVFKSFGEFRTPLLFSLLGLSGVAILGDIGLGMLPTMPLRAKAALGLAAVSQGWWQLIVWTHLRVDPSLWRFWWVCMVASVTMGHLLALWKTMLRHDWIEKATPVAAAIAGAVLLSLGLHKELPYNPGPLDIALLSAASGVSVLGSIVVRWRWIRRSGTPQPMARWARVSWILGSHAALFMAGWYIGGAGRDQRSEFESMPSALAGLSTDQVKAQVRSDLEKLRSIVAGLEELTKKSAALHAEMAAKRKDEKREFYTPEEDDRVRWHFVSYLSLRSALLRLVATYANFEMIREPELRSQCFMLGYASASIAFQHALLVVQGYGKDPLVARKLNEREPLWGIDAGMLDQIRASASNSRSLEKFEEMGAYYAENRAAWQGAKVWGEGAEFAWLDDRILLGVEYVKVHGLSRPKAWFDALAKRVKEDTYKPVYAAQSMLSTMIGDFRIVQDPPFISVDQIRTEIGPRLRPGDIFLERRNWFMSNAFLPGFWPHSALYIGTLEDLRRLGIADHPEVRKRMAEYVRKAPDGEAHTVLEAISEGVVFNSITESMHADYVAVLRPRLTDAEIGQAIVKAFSHQGKPYDFEFDFFTSDKLVCTELVYRSYEGLIHFDLVRVMGRDTLPALEIARKFARERGGEKRQFDLVVFMDFDASAKGARVAGEDAFCSTIQRERAFSE